MSAALHVADVVAWSGGVLRHGDADAALTGVSLDSRTIEAGQLFVAIRGERLDGHRFLAGARERGAAGFLVERGRAEGFDPGAAALVEVDDATQALGDLAREHRARFRGPVVAITGSNGKTTTKEMCAAILGTCAPCLKNEGNLNNQFGLPVTLLRRSERHRAVVVEIGTNAPGEIAMLAAIAQPTIGVITNVAMAHVEGLGSRAGVAREKGALVAALPPEGIAVLNHDDPHVMRQAARTRARIVRFGRGPDADVRAEGVAALGDRGFAFELVAPQGRTGVEVAGLGEPVVANALAASAAALAAGASLADVAEGLAAYRPMGGRMEPVAGPRNVIVINDTYNANPQSVAAALRSLVELKGSSRGVAVLGDMAELGEQAHEAHRETGRLAARLGVDLLFLLGELAGETAAGALETGMEPERVHVGKDHAETAARVREVLRGDDWVLVKGSRSMRMERVVQALTGGEG